ncbi:MAG: oxidoreductase [Actinomycetota bacterium]|nr:oxidoreductase [Actinomycetota bacterium]
MAGWTADDIPDLSGRTALVTGANSGLGFHTALQLGKHGARVLMAARDATRGQQALVRARAAAPDASFELVSLDLADLSSIHSAADDLATRADMLDILVNNAGVMAIPYQQTADGFEKQLGTNHLGHFALTGRVLPQLLAAPAPRVVTVSSGAHRSARGIRFDDLQSQASYSPLGAYAQSKLANLLFAAELDRRAGAAGTTLVSAAAHPGLAATSLMQARPGQPTSRLMSVGAKVAFAVFGQSGAAGAWPQLYAATMPDVIGGEYFGPSGMGEQRGHPQRVGRADAANDEASAARLWEMSAELTGVTYDQLKAGGT